LWGGVQSTLDPGDEMAGGGGPFPKSTFKVVRYVTLKDDQLDKLAELLGIPKSERGDLYSGEIHIIPAGPTKKTPRKRSKEKKRK
jgi:hypothetical protein